MCVRSVRPFAAWVLAGAVCLVSPAVATAQVAELPPPPPVQAPSSAAIGESYHLELAGGMWNPTVFGTISSEQFGIPGSQISFTGDLGYKQTQFADGRVVLKLGRKHKLRAQYTPVSYSAESKLTRNIVFNGILYTVNLPIQSQFDWKVWRFGYEFDVISTSRGFFGILLEGRYTQMEARLDSAVNSEYTKAKAPLPAIGAVARIYPLRRVALTGEISGLKIPKIGEDYEAHYADIDVYATVNLTNNFGAQAGWRRMTTFLRVETDQGDLKFQGFWFGGAIRF